jgi:hypothetical protein
MRAIFVQIRFEMGRAHLIAQPAADSIREVREPYWMSVQYDLPSKLYREANQDI